IEIGAHVDSMHAVCRTVGRTYRRPRENASPDQPLISFSPSVNPVRITKSTRKKNRLVRAAMISTMIVVVTTSRRVGHVIFAPSARTCVMNLTGLVATIGSFVYARGDVAKLDRSFKPVTRSVTFHAAETVAICARVRCPQL